MNYKRVNLVHQSPNKNRKSHWSKIILWTPRILAMMYIIFIGMFAFDSISIGILIELIPSIILALILVVAWKKPFIGGVIFIIMGIVFTIFFNTYRTFLTFLLISVPLILIGVLFIYNFKRKK